MRIDLASGRAISLSSMTQWRTNGGLLCGTPSEATNDEKLRRVVDEARQFGGNLGEPLVIDPPRASVPGDSVRGTSGGEWLPKVTCIAVFNSDALSSDPASEPYSSLVVAWFQNAFALPIDDAVLTSIRRIDWERRATGWSW